jgi:hypothetical protein
VKLQEVPTVSGIALQGSSLAGACAINSCPKRRNDNNNVSKPLTIGLQYFVSKFYFPMDWIRQWRQGIAAIISLMITIF